MKKIEAIIRTNKLNSVKAVLHSVGIHGMTLTDVRGIGQQKGNTITYRGSEALLDFVQRVKVEIAVTDDEADAIVDAIFQAAHTGEVGDGRILVSRLECVIRIRTGEVDDANAVETSRHSECHEVSPARRAITPSSSEVWSGPRTFSGSDNAAMNYWAKR